MTGSRRRTYLAILLLITAMSGISCSHPEEEMDGLIARGDGQVSAARYNEAIISFSKAEAIAVKAGDSYRLGTIYQKMAGTYRATCGYFEEIAYLNKASEAFTEAGKPFSSRNMLFESGLASFHGKDYAAAGKIFNRILQESRAEKDSLLEARCLSACAALSVAMDSYGIPDYKFKPETAIRQIGRITNDLKYPLTSQDRGVLAYAYAQAGNADEAGIWLKRALGSAETPQELALARYREYQIRSAAGDDREALQSLRYVMEYNSSVDMMALKRSVAAAREDFLSHENSMVYNRLRISRLWTAVILLMLFAMVFAVVGFYRYKKLQNNQILAEEKAETEKYMSLAEELQGKLQISTEAKASQTAATDHKRPIPGYDMLERLCEQYYIYEGTDNLQTKILKEVKDLIQDLRENPDSVRNMEEALDSNYGNVMRRLREQIPNLKEDDLKLYVFAASGLSSTSISTIMEKEKANIYNRIYRLKGKINGSDATDKEEFLSHLSR